MKSKEVKIPYCHLCKYFYPVSDISFVCNKYGLRRNLANGNQTELKYGCWEEREVQRWYQKWWGGAIIGLAVAIIAGLILWLVGFLS